MLYAPRHGGLKVIRILYAGYDERERAERTLGELLELGMAAEDLSLIALAPGVAASEKRAAALMVDSGRGLPPLIPSERESKVGGGIATTQPEDDVSYVEEMDDSQSVAEDLAEPFKERWYGLDDEEDASRFADTGTIDATRPPGTPFTLRKPKGPTPSMSVQAVNGVLILGDGPLATEMLIQEIAEAADVETSTRLALENLGVVPREARHLAHLMKRGGAIIAAVEIPGKVRFEDIESTIESSGGHDLKTFVQMPLVRSEP